MYVLSGRFLKYDHGSKENLRLYGMETPPEYNLTNVRTKIHVMFGGNDYLIPPQVS